MKRLVATLAAAWLAAASPAGAASCNVQSAGIVFGAYDVLDPGALDGAGSVTVDCDSAVPFSVGLGAGGGSYSQRRMTAGTSDLDYNLYSDAARLIVWGDGVGASDVSASGTSVDLPIYGRIPARQNVRAGVYVDTITITVSY
jgi:spore coat protein U-like protein